MHIVLIGTEHPPQELLDALDAANLAPRAWSASGDEGVAGIAASLREAEAMVVRDAPTAVLVTDASDVALIGAVTAVKEGIPTVALAPADAQGLPAHVAHLSMPATEDPAAIAAAVKRLTGPTLPRP